MYNTYYAESTALSCEFNRNHEWSALDQVVTALKTAKEHGLVSSEGKQALHNTMMVWSFLLEDLSNSDNDLPAQLRADLISIGIFVIKQVGRLREAETAEIDGLIDINTTIRDGLNQ
ncbi:flagellar biosynthesis regulator FlaF [Cohaesibacter celericrescens]|jgi:flagellar protein FlaF|nr:flagellar biosynthesis regulator FlaF [Cohaesibacter celericrescens]